MRTIWKFQLEKKAIQVIQMPKGAQLLTAQTQGTGVCIWAIVNPESEKEDREIWIRGTGHEIPGKVLQHIGTFQMDGGSLVFHVLEGKIDG